MAQLLSVIGRSTRIDFLHFLRGSGSSHIINKTIVFKCVENCKFVPYRQRFYSKNPEKQEEKSLQYQPQSDLSDNVKPITFKTVKETTKTASYLGVILLGVGITGMIFYTVLSELFSNKSPNNVYSKALDTVINDTRIQDALGEPLSGYGEENRRGRRQHVSHVLYQKDGEKRLRMKFYISGSRKRATVHLEMREDESGNYVYRYLFVELDDFGRHPIVLEDNRHEKLGSSKVNPLQELDLSSPLNMNLDSK